MGLAGRAYTRHSSDCYMTTAILPTMTSIEHIERLKTQRLSTVTSGLGVPTLKLADTPLLALPSVMQPWRYRVAYWTGTIRNLTVPHGLHADTVQPVAAPMVVTPRLRAKWQRLFRETGGTHEPDTPVPYLYNQSVGTLLYTRMFAQLGINFRHLLHVQHETKHWSSVDDWVHADRQELHLTLRGAWRLGDGKAMVGVRCAVHRARDEGGALLGTINDRFIIRQVPEPDLERLTSGRALLRSLAELRRREPQLDATAEGSVVSAIRLSPTMGKQFGAVSGDYNPVHTTRFAARVFGIRRPFLQGLGLRNAIMRQLALHDRPLTRVNISFASPAFLGQTLRVVMQGEAFEVIDESGVVVAFGASAHDV